MACVLDHLVIGAASLEQGATFIREHLGVEIGPGGSHPLMGTHNRLMRLGQSAFLEVIAIDPDASQPLHPRWFGLDDSELQAELEREPKLISWVLRVSDIDTQTSDNAFSAGEVIAVTRGAYSWLITVRPDGSRPENGVIPNLIQWDEGIRPWEQMAGCNCSLDELTLVHPNPQQVKQHIQALHPEDFDFLTFEAGDTKSLRAKISTPDGSVFI